MEFKNTKLEKVDDIGKFYGYASVFNIEDYYNDIILNGAFRETIKNKSDIALLWQHDQDNIIGKIDRLEEDYVGLYVEGQILVDKNNNIYNFIKNNIINGLSIGYRVKETEFDEKGRRIIKSIDLMEISVVSFPANKFSNIIYCKSVNNG